MAQLVLLLAKHISRLPYLITSHLCTEAMSKEDLDAYFAPPKSVCSSTSLDRGSFTREIQLPAVKLADPSLCSKFLKRLAHVILKYPFLKKVVDYSGKDGKVCNDYIIYMLV